MTGPGEDRDVQVGSANKELAARVYRPTELLHPQCFSSIHPQISYLCIGQMVHLLPLRDFNSDAQRREVKCKL